MTKKYWALDTETTGIDFNKDRVIEIALIEIEDRQITGRQYHTYINPDGMKIPLEAFRVHGISNEMLNDKPKFKEIADDFLNHIKGYDLIIHNAHFDISMLKAEFKRIGINFESPTYYANVIDTLIMSREKRPGKKHSLDALCSQYEIDRSERTLHGALIDTKLLADVYLAMTREQDNFLADNDVQEENQINYLKLIPLSEEEQKKLIILKANEQELETHQAYLEKIQAELW